MKLDLFLLAIVPILIGMFWIRSKDRYCREPLIHLIKFFFNRCFSKCYNYTFRKFTDEV